MRYPLEIRLKPSRLAAVLIAAIHLVAAISFLSVPMAIGAKVFATIVIMGSALMTLRLERSRAGVRLILEQGGRLQWGASGRMLRVRPVAGCADFGWGIWLRWEIVTRSGGRPVTGAAMVLRDSVRADDWRPLRIWLRHCAVDAMRG